MRASILPILLCLFASLTFARSIVTLKPAAKPLPLIVWHGLGDKFDNPGLHAIGALVNTTWPGTYVHYIRLADDGGADRTASFFGDLRNQTATVCEQLAAEPKLFDAATQTMRVDALGFSQGGQFLRGLVQTCEGLSVRSLVTFGSQHNGIADVKPCGTWDLLCKGAMALMKGNVWTDSVQTRVVPAQYFRTLDLDTGRASEQYLEHSHWLADMNNERGKKNQTYAERIAQLEKFIMVVFDDDTTVVPKESGWFAEVNRTSGEVTPLRERPIYKEDWIGLKKLDKKKGLVFLSNPGDHMQLDEDVMNKIFKKYFGYEKEGNEYKVEDSSIRLKPMQIQGQRRTSYGEVRHEFL